MPPEGGLATRRAPARGRPHEDAGRRRGGHVDRPGRGGGRGPRRPDRRPARGRGTRPRDLDRRRARLLQDSVRGLKGLGLTESLPVGYRISPHGRAYLDATLG
ncbi:hypothetical protein EQW78_05790 [Oerskovia turbata]|uniref:Uncharacterized protein n=1 Tax=Oerskovia turbata TaxID=1713 RepID=A0A4Q1KXP5_9CELL|nr:hypothetical protein EQW73_11820 [Oerskovia turbata]RXR35121.1 hypothetical protein EQW78_05790 [Oerskovia turbata]TGJ96371.1 hypothetical protein DLJ96_11710 [Actinotalea fermentans ATCC 43279 = JCM 9966 = DSM 3133]